jgi:hypothetical protein
MSSGTLCRVALLRSDVSENLLSPSSGFLKLTGFHSCVTVETKSQKISFNWHRHESIPEDSGFPTLCPSMERQSNSVTTVIRPWKPISLRKPEDTRNSPKRRLELVLHGTKSQKKSLTRQLISKWSQRQSYITTECQLASLSRCQGLSWPRYKFNFYYF